MAHLYLCFPGWKKKAFTMSYDDGVVQDKRLIELMKKNGIKGTFNLNGSVLLNPSGRRLGKDEALALYRDDGIEVAVHTYTHPFLDKLTREMASYEVIKDREVLEEMFGGLVRGMAYPMGTFSDMTVEVLRNCGIAYARTTVSTGRFDIPSDWLRMPATCHHDDPRVFELIDQFLGRITGWGGPWLFYLWGHAYEFDDKNNWSHIESILDRVGSHEDIWYATNIEIYDYVEAYRSLTFSVNSSSVYNPTATDVYFQYNGKNVLAPAGTTTKIKFN